MIEPVRLPALVFMNVAHFVEGNAMKLDLAQAQPMGSLIVEGTHQPFHALACALRPSTIRIARPRSDK